MRSRASAIRVFALLGALLLLGACAQRAGRGTPSAVSDRDAMFMRDAAADSVADVRLGQLAMQNGASEAVKEFANAMVNDQTVADQQIRIIADRKKVNLPTGSDEKYARAADRLSGFRGPEFDRQYMAEMVRDHERTISQFRDEASAGQDPDVQEFAEKTLPILQQQLDHAKALQRKLGG